MEKSFLYLASVSYDGSNFSGWAKQPNDFTVQGYLENKLLKTFKKTISILGASRTDKGVHAKEQKFRFFLTFLIDDKKLFSILKKTFLPLVLLNSITKKILPFHPISSVKEKEYRYLINVGKFNILKDKYVWNYNKDLELVRLEKILKIFEGKHDFSNFSYRESKSSKNKLRKINELSLKRNKKGKLLTICVKASGFLRYQIRSVIGESINCYEGLTTISNLLERLAGKSLSINKRLAPASGLYLWKIKY